MAAMMKSAQSARAYTGPVKACILDWSGTTADKYVLAPALAFLGVFSKYKVPITMSEARGPMGLRKDFHIKALTEVPTIRQRWRDVHGKDPDQTDIDKMVRDFIPMQLSTLRNYTELIPGVADTVKRLKSENNIKFGCTTGFYKSMVDILLEESKKQGYEPDCSVAGDEVYNGARPKPFMIYRNLDLLDVHPIQAVVKVDDTVSGIGEAIQAGCWGVGVARYSNYMDIDSLDQEAQLLPEEIESRLEKTREILHESGAHYVIDSLADLPEVIEDINVKMSNGVSP